MTYDKSNARIVYMGTPAISATVLQGILDAGFRVVGVVTNPDKKLGRKGILTPCPVKEVALAHDIPVFQPEKIRLDYAFLESLHPDALVTMAYGQIVPAAALAIPVKGCVNLHGSLLPALRGAAPIQRAIDNGLSVTGVTLMEMVAAMDAGRMYDKAEVVIAEDDDTTSLSEKIALAARDLIVKDLIPYLNDELPGIPQDEAAVTFAAKILPEEEHLDLSLAIEALLRRIRCLAQHPGGYLYLDEAKFKILKAHDAKQSSIAAPGTIVSAKKGVFLAVNGGVISLDSVQPEGKKAMDGKSFANGCRDVEGKILR